MKIRASILIHGLILATLALSACGLATVQPTKEPVATPTIARPSHAPVANPTAVQATQIPVATPTTVSPTVNPPATPTIPKEPTKDPTADWKAYTNKDYGFSLRYPANWTLQERPKYANQPDYVYLNQGNIRLVIGLKRPNDDFPFRTGVPGGDFQEAGTIKFLGQELSKRLLVAEGKTKMVDYYGKALEQADLVLFFSIGDFGTPDYRAVEIPESLQKGAEQVIATFQRTKT